LWEQLYSLFWPPQAAFGRVSLAAAAAGRPPAWVMFLLNGAAFLQAGHSLIG
jgi:hypothetical protein